MRPDAGLMDAEVLDLAALTAPGDPIGAMSPLAGLDAEGLGTALERLGHRIRRTPLPPPGEGDPFAAAAEFGRGLAQGWQDSGPDLLLCDGYLSGLAGHAAAAQGGGRVILWLGTLGLPTETNWRRLAAAVARSALAVFTSSREVALWVRHERLSTQVEVVQPAVDPAAIQEHRPWNTGPGRPPGGLARRPDTRVAVVGNDLSPGGWSAGSSLPRARQDATPAAGAAGPPGNPVIRVLHRAAENGAAIDITEIDPSDPARAAEELAGADVAVTGLGTDGGRTTLRAMACGLAVISLPRVPDRELVVDRVSGIAARDSHELVAAVRELSADPFLREALGQGAIDRVQATHAADVVAELLERRLREVLDEQPDGRGAGLRTARQLGIELSDL